MARSGCGWCGFALLAAVCVPACAQPTWNDVPIATVPTFTGTKTLMLDIFAPGPAFTGRRPLAIYVHGGGWQSGTHNNNASFLLTLRNQGFVVASCTYRLSGEAIFPAQIEDVKGAIRWLRANAATYNIDPYRIAVGGTSAGGHLVALLGTSAGVPELEGTTAGGLEWSSRVQAVVDFFGPTDILQMNPDVVFPPGGSVDHDAFNSAESKLIGFNQAGQGIGVLRANLTNPIPPYPAKAALARLLSPMTHLTADDAPVFIGHGDQDTVVALKQSRRLRDAYVSAGLSVSLTEVAGAGHGFLGVDIENAARAFIVAELSRCRSDLNRDGSSDFGDFLAFFNWYDTGDLRSDLSLDDSVDFGDFLAFFDAFDSGC